MLSPSFVSIQSVVVALTDNGMRQLKDKFRTINHIYQEPKVTHLLFFQDSCLKAVSGCFSARPLEQQMKN